ncbi:MAG TPA: ATP-binding protein [Polyangia bacterium]|nr:ATP-binding protein [Polyangia bacterium]
MELLRGVIDATRLLVVVADQTGVVQLINRAAARTTGLTEAAWHRPIWELAAFPAERELLRGAFTPFRREAFPPAVMFHLTRAEQAPRGVDWDVRVVNDRPEPRIVFTGVEVSERLIEHQRLRQAEVFQRQILDRLPAIVWTTDEKMRTTFSAGGGLSALGLASGEVSIIGTPVTSYFHTEDPHHPAIAAHLRALAGESTVMEMAWFGRRFHSRIEPLRDDRGQIVGVIGVSFDVTELKQTAQALHESESLLTRVVDANVIGVFFWEENGRITQANDAFLQIVGFSREELLSPGISWQALTAPEHRPLDQRALAELRATGRCTAYEKAYITKGGVRVPVLVGGATFDRPTAGEMAGAAFVVDMREQARLRDAREKLLRNERAARVDAELANARLQLLVEGSQALSPRLNPNEILQSLAELTIPALADWCYTVHRGWDDGNMLVASAHGDPNKRALLARLGPHRPEAGDDEGPGRVFRTGEVALYEDVNLDRLSARAWDPGEALVLRELGARAVLCVPIAGRSGVDAVMILVSSQDPLRYNREEVLLAQDLAARAAVSLENGRLLFEALDAVRARDDFLAVAAHELRTPLTSLLLHIQMLRQGLARDEADLSAFNRSVGAVDGQARRLSNLVDGLLDVARVGNNRMGLRFEEVDLREMVDDVVSTMAADFRGAGCRVLVTAPQRATVRWDRDRIEQVLTNLFSNAIKFGAGRPIELCAAVRGPMVEISVRDHGIGVSKEDQARIFGRFERAVSTRHFGGLGLGLYITAQILRAHRGSIRVESEPGQGARFIVTLPRGLEEAATFTDSPMAH